MTHKIWLVNPVSASGELSFNIFYTALAYTNE